MLLQPGFEQAPQIGEALRKLPAGERRSLIQSQALVFEQGQVVQRIVDRGLARIGALVAGNHLSATDVLNLMHVALDQHLTVDVLGRDRVVVGAIADQRDLTDPGSDLVAGFVGRGRQRQHVRTVALESLCNGLRMTKQTVPAARSNLPQAER